jgi:hypothetical protein
MKDLLLDTIIGIIVLLVINVLISGLVGWIYAITLIYISNNWFPFAVINGFIIFLIIPFMAILSAIRRCYRRFKSTGTKERFHLRNLIMLWE